MPLQDSHPVVFQLGDRLTDPEDENIIPNKYAFYNINIKCSEIDNI